MNKNLFIDCVDKFGGKIDEEKSSDTNKKYDEDEDK